MENLKLISVRVEPMTLRAIGKLTSKHTYWNRSFVINKLLETVLECAADGTLYNMLSTNHSFDKGYEVTFFSTADKAVERSQIRDY